MRHLKLLSIKQDLSSATVGLEEKLWEALYGDAASEDEKLNAKMDFLGQKIMFQQEKLAAVESEYQQMLDALGADAKETQEAYNRYLQAQIDLAELIGDQKELLEQSSSTKSDSMNRYYELLAETLNNEELMKALMGQGWTAEDIEKWAREQSGWDPDAVAEDMKKDTTSTLGIVTDAYKRGLNNLFGEELMTTFTEFGSEYASSLGTGFLEKFREVIVNIENAFASLETKNYVSYKQHSK